MALDSLTELDTAMLELEHQWWPTAGAKEQAIRVLLGMSPTRYYQRLNQLVDTEAALERDAVTVNRLGRVKSARSHARRIP